MASEIYSSLAYVKVVETPWGRESYFATPAMAYQLSKIEINPGNRTSLHFHHERTESFHLISGQVGHVILIHGPNPKELEETHMDTGFGYTIEPRVLHRFENRSEEVVAVIMEGSDPHVDVTERVHDDSGRYGQPINVRLF